MAVTNYWYRTRLRDGRLRLEVEGMPDVWVEAADFEDGMEYALILEIARHQGCKPGKIVLHRR